MGVVRLHRVEDFAHRTGVHLTKSLSEHCEIPISLWMIFIVFHVLLNIITNSQFFSKIYNYECGETAKGDIIAYMYTVNQIFQSALRPFSGTSANSFADPNGIVADAVRKVSSEVDLIESKRTAPLLPALYTGDNMYLRPADADTILDIYPPSGRNQNELADFSRTDPMSISRDIHLENANFLTEYRSGVPLLRVQPSYFNDTPIILNHCDSLTANGTITASSDANNLALNTVFYLNGTASIDFNISAGNGNALITIVGMDEVDISTITRDGVFTLGIFVPASLVGKITNLKLKVGNDALTYYLMSSNTNSFGGQFTEGFNVVRFERRSASETGTVDDATISYMQVDIVHTLVDSEVATGVKLDTFMASKGVGYIISYYSKYHFKDATTNLLIQEPSSPTLADHVIVEKDAFDLVVAECKKIMDMELRGEAGGAVYKQAERDLNGVWGDFSKSGTGMYENYRLKFPSERRPVITQYENHPYE